MPKRLTLAKHLPVADLEQRYRKASDSVACSQWQILWLMAQLRLPVRLHLIFLPAYSPELQPTERLWPLTNESLVNRTFATLGDLHENQVRRCLVLQATPERIRGLTAFQWWPQLA